MKQGNAVRRSHSGHEGVFSKGVRHVATARIEKGTISSFIGSMTALLAFEYRRPTTGVSTIYHCPQTTFTSSDFNSSCIREKASW